MTTFPSSVFHQNYNTKTDPFKHPFESFQQKAERYNEVEYYGEFYHNTEELRRPFENRPSCQSTQLETVKTPPPHHAKLICDDCGRFIRWLPSPATIEKERELRHRIEQLRRLELKGWSGIFVRDLSRRSSIAHREGKRFKLSSKQLTHLTRIEIEMGVQADG